jgi:prolyl-tRNA editing enzyme YbaK/EbsC (Cys-tRNA(Pro) deacylase)
MPQWRTAAKTLRKVEQNMNENSAGATPLTSLSASARKVQAALAAAGIETQVIEHASAARTSQQAAETLGCTVAEIAKSLVFRGKHSGKPVLVVASGAHRIDEKKLAQVIGEPVEKPDATFVREVTGFAIGGIPPLGHAQSLFTVLDQTLFRFERVYAAGGTPNAMFPVSPQSLLKATGATLADVHA